MRDRAVTYTIRRVADFMTVPLSRRRDCLMEFEAWLSTAERAQGVLDYGPFIWHDDGLSHANLVLPDGSVMRI